MMRRKFILISSYSIRSILKPWDEASRQSQTQSFISTLKLGKPAHRNTIAVCHHYREIHVTDEPIGNVFIKGYNGERKKNEPLWYKALRFL